MKHSLGHDRMWKNPLQPSAGRVSEKRLEREIRPQRPLSPSKRVPCSRVYPRTNGHNIEIIHRFRIHDAEHAVKHIFGKDADIIGSTKTKKQFNDYVNNHFSMFNSGNDLKLTSVGYESDGQFFWVYQETTEPPALENLSIRHNALRDICHF